MVTKKGAGKKTGAKLKIKKETLKDLVSKGNVKGGIGNPMTLKCGGGGRDAGKTFQPTAGNTAANCC